MRLTYVPLHTIIVTRPLDAEKPDGPTHQVDALAEYNRTGKAFKFTEDEVKEIIAGYDGNAAMALRSPTDEVETDDGETIRAPLASNEKPRAAAKVAPKDDAL